MSTSLSMTEYSILSQLRKKPMRLTHLLGEDSIKPYLAFDDLIQASLVKEFLYEQQWRFPDHLIVICHLTFEGRMALIKHEAIV